MLKFYHGLARAIYGGAGKYRIAVRGIQALLDCNKTFCFEFPKGCAYFLPFVRL